MNQCPIVRSSNPTAVPSSASGSNGHHTSLSSTHTPTQLWVFPLTPDFAQHRKPHRFCGSLPEFPVLLPWQPLDGAILSANAAAVIHTLFRIQSSSHMHVALASLVTQQPLGTTPQGDMSYANAVHRGTRGRACSSAAMDHMLHNFRLSSSRWKTGLRVLPIL